MNRQQSSSSINGPRIADSAPFGSWDDVDAVDSVSPAKIQALKDAGSFVPRSEGGSSGGDPYRTY